MFARPLIGASRLGEARKIIGLRRGFGVLHLVRGDGASPPPARAQNCPDHPNPAPVGPAMMEGALIPKIRHRPEASLAEVMPSSAPAATSLSQWRLSLTRDQATALAIP